MKKILTYIVALSMLIPALTACAEEVTQSTEVTAYAAFEAEYTNRDCDPSYDESSAKLMNLSGGGQININKEGVYILTGEVNDGSIVIDAPETDKIQIVLRNASITSSDGPAIYAKQCDKLFITLEGTNTIADSTIYTLAEGEDEPDAAIFTKNDVTFNGSGSLSVTGNYKHGIASKDDVKITGGAISVNSVEDGLKGRDSVLIKDGMLNITAGTDGIQSNNNSGEDKGRISVDGGSVAIVCGNDGIQAESILQVNGGTVDIKAGDEENTEIKTEGGFGVGRMRPEGMPEGTMMPIQEGEIPQRGMPGGGRMRPEGTMIPMPEGEMPQRGMPGDGRMRPEGMPEGTMMPMGEDELPPGGMPGGMRGGRGGMRQEEEMPPGGMPFDNEANEETENSVSIKGLKSANALYINGGTITVSAQDDAVHSDIALTVNGGTLNLRSADDAVHAEYSCVINDGDITVERSYEGIEGKAVKINGGNISVSAEDDGINASDPESTGGMPGRGDYSIYVEINGGTVKVVSRVDGIDSNGNIIINGGDVAIDGPSNGMECAIDCDGRAYVNGGNVAASGVGSSTGFSEESEQESIAVIFSSRQATGTTVTLYDSKGNKINSITPTQATGGVVFSSEKLKKGNKYTVKTDSISVEVELSELRTIVSDTGEAVSENRGMRMMGR